MARSKEEKSTLLPEVRRVPVESTRVVSFDTDLAGLRVLLAGAEDSSRFAGALVWLRCRVPEGMAAPTAEDVRDYLKRCGAVAARVDVSEVAARRERAESEVARLASARERMSWWLAKSSTSDAVRVEVERILNAEDV